MLPVITKTRPGRCCDSILAACRVGTVCPECDTHSATVCRLSSTSPSLQASGTVLSCYDGSCCDDSAFVCCLSSTNLILQTNRQADRQAHIDCKIECSEDLSSAKGLTLKTKRLPRLKGQWGVVCLKETKQWIIAVKGHKYHPKHTFKTDYCSCHTQRLGSS